LIDGGIQQYTDAHYVCALEAIWRLLESWCFTIPIAVIFMWSI
jgi:hypothetical protein